MDVLHPHCAGLDIHQQTVVACVLTPGAKGVPVKQIRTFDTMTADLLALGDWLAGQGVTHAAMEASSHGLSQHRLDGVRLAAAAFTNIGATTWIITRPSSTIFVPKCDCLANSCQKARRR